jgi:hypothetical protein
MTSTKNYAYVLMVSLAQPFGVQCQIHGLFELYLSGQNPVPSINSTQAVLVLD